MSMYKLRRVLLVAALLIIAAIPLASQPVDVLNLPTTIMVDKSDVPADLASLPVKGRAPKTGYERSQFGDGWQTTNGCDTRNIILARDLKDEVVDENCKVVKGALTDPYTGKSILFIRGGTTSADVQIDHVVALSDAWQKGAQQLPYDMRVALANDPINLLAVDGPTNQQKSDGDAATWLPPNKVFRCQYVQRQINIKQKYSLWVTTAERDAMARVLGACTNASK